MSHEVGKAVIRQSSFICRSRYYPSTTAPQRSKLQLLPQQQRRLESSSSPKNNSAAAKQATAEVETASEEAIKATKEAIQALKDAKTKTASEAIVDGAAAKSASSSEPSLWSRLRTPALFGAGLYLGLVLFGEHRETKKGSDYLAELKASFEDEDKKR